VESLHNIQLRCNLHGEFLAVPTRHRLLRLSLLGLDVLAASGATILLRIVIVWSVTLLLLLTVSLGWYITLPVAFALSSSIEGLVSGAGLTALRIVQYVTILWGPIWDLFILLWAFMESHRVDFQGQVYGG